MTQFFRREPKRQKTEDEQQVERQAQAEKAVQKELLRAKHVALIKEVGIGNSLSDKPKIVKAGPPPAELLWSIGRLRRGGN